MSESDINQIKILALITILGYLDQHKIEWTISSSLKFSFFLTFVTPQCLDSYFWLLLNICSVDSSSCTFSLNVGVLQGFIFHISLFLVYKFFLANFITVAICCFGYCIHPTLPLVKTHLLVLMEPTKTLLLLIYVILVCWLIFNNQHSQGQHHDV